MRCKVRLRPRFALPAKAGSGVVPIWRRTLVAHLLPRADDKISTANNVTLGGLRARFHIFTVHVMVPLLGCVLAQCIRVARAAWTLWEGTHTVM